MSNTDLLGSETANGAQDASGTVADAAEAPRTSANGGTTKRRAGLSGMVLAELRELAGQLGITGTTGMRKGDLIAAIKERQSAGSSAPAKSASPAPAETLPLGVGDKTEPASEPKTEGKTEVKAESKTEPKTEGRASKAKPEQKADQAAAPTRTDTPPAEGEDGERREGGSRRRRGSGRAAGSPDTDQRSGDDRGDKSDKRDDRSDNRSENRSENRSDKGDRSDNRDNRDGRDKGDRQGRDRDRDRDRDRNDGRGRDRNQNRNRDNGPDDDDDDEGGRRRGRRFRDRRRRGGGRGEGGGGADTEVREDDVLLPVAGVLDVLDNYAFVRTSGYLSGPNDVYVSLSLVRKYGLRRGDAITGMVRQPREGEQQRQKFNPLVRVETINGFEPDQAKNRPEFTKLTPLYPNERLRLETEPHLLTTRVIDLVMPVGKGQRALIVSPPKAGKTSVLQSIANAITTNNPECYLMVVLVDERPEEVTDMQRSVKGEVIASTFDRPPGDHTTVAELSIERAKRLVEMGHDVVVLLDSITRLGRAYNLAAPASGRILSGGVDSTALFPPKRFLGAARNIEDGGSLTIFATALVETGSAGDTVIFEEFKGTGNAELKLDRKIADKRTFPAVDVDASGTRKEELLLSPDELAITVKLRRVLHALDTQQAIDLLLTQLRKTRTNIEFLMQVAKNTPTVNDD
ncbi:transcription termination factor Rho [Actinophytocola gossypii]|uniref:Transcription termination factor Rho n=1 Tax=Actinophytocola gossypii TaxID=2812003 RepID=A0ABT2JBY1_9PSEU|nr:transcription termination factor Rho [Actinophytocola gossypii]MCT2585079.1 transcription termination factor Rho [Actinophytocola gossypii]